MTTEKRFRNGVVPVRRDKLAAAADKEVTNTRTRLERNEFHVALQSIWSLVTRANRYVDQTAPFKPAKYPTQAQCLDEVLYQLVETCRILAVLLWPFLPGTAGKIYTQLGLLGAPDKFNTSGWGDLSAGLAIGEPAPLFPRKDA